MQDYYGELHKGLMRCSIVEETEDSIVCFYSGSRREIQDIVDYKEFNTVNQLFQFAMLAEKELQGCDLLAKSKVSTIYVPRMAPSLGIPKASSFHTPPPANKQPTTSGVAMAPKTSSSRPLGLGKNSMQEPSKSVSSVASMGCTSGIQCHRYYGFGHV
jgi:hypothetical protein